MITNFSISNYRCFEHLELTSLSRVNLIVGKNGAGKSALLEALWLGSEQLLHGHWSLFDILRLRDELPDAAATATELFRALMSIRREVGEVKIQVNEIEYDLSVGFDHGKSQIKFGELSINTDVVKQSLANRDLLTSDVFYYKFIPQAGLHKNDLAALWDDITLTDLEDVVDEAIRIIRPDAQRIAFIGNKDSRRVPVVKIQGKGAVPMSRLGDGLVRVFGVALAIVNSQGEPVFIDEIETGIHFSVMPDLWRLIFSLAEKLNVQVFVTTHSWDCISAFGAIAKEVPDADAQLIRLERNGDDVRAVRYDQDEIAIAAKQGIEVR